MSHSSYAVANSVLFYSFRDRRHVSLRTLYEIITDLDREYRKRTGRRLLMEFFFNDDETGARVLPSLEFKFGCFKNGPVVRYARRAGEQDSPYVLVVTEDDVVFWSILKDLWEKRVLCFSREADVHYSVTESSRPLLESLPDRFKNFF